MSLRATIPSVGIATTLASLTLSFVVEDGRGLLSSNSYVGVEEATELLQDHQLLSTWTNLTVPQMQQALKAATTWLDDRFRFYGQSMTSYQALQWPRTKNYDRFGEILQEGTIPWELQKATAYVAVKWVQDQGLFNEVPAQGQVRSFSEEGVSISFDPKESAGFLLSGTRLPEIELMLKSLGEYKTAEFWPVRQTGDRL